MTAASGLYTGRVTHTRLAPQRHRLSYRVFYVLLELDELEQTAARLRLFSRNRLNLLSFHDADHLEGGAESLRARVDRVLGRAGIDLAGGRVQLLCMPRMFGHAFNPISLYFCRDENGAPACVIYEVNNTFGQRHSYVMPVQPADVDAEGVLRQSCAKQFYVSPFLAMELTYRFQISLPGETVTVAVAADDCTGPVIATAFTGSRTALTDRTILKAVAGHPLLGLKVLAGIHWEALRIWLKGIKLRSRPAPPEDAITIAIAAPHQELPTARW